MIAANSASKAQIKNFLKDTLLEIMSILKAECGSLFMFDGINKELVLESFQNSGAAAIDGVKFRMGEGVCGKVIENSAPVLVKDIDTDHRFARNGFAHYHTKSFISVPLVSPDGLVGLINIADKSNREPFTEKDLEFAATLSEYACIIAYNLDLSDRLRREKDELDKQKSLLEKYANVGKLAAGVVHEVNNPLDGIMRYTNMLLAQTDSNSVAMEYLVEIKRGLVRIGNITKSLLQFSHQVNSGTHKYSFADIHELIKESIEGYRNIAEGRIDIKTDFSLQKSLILDFGLSHVCVNMVKNALDSMDEGGRLEIATYSDEDFVYISFKDTGSGICPSVIDSIFEPFFTTKSQDKGTGLGLSICREIVGRYDGNIAVKSELGKGTEFLITIPSKYLKNA